MNTQAYVPRRQPDSIWAISLRNTMWKRESDFERNEFFEEVEFWQDSIKADYRYPENSEKKREAERIHAWYWNEVRSRSYQARNWKVPPERSMLFRKFRSDPYYLLKNLSEIVARSLVEEVLRAEGRDVKVYTTSDSDDVFAGVDLIVEEKTPAGKTHVGIDLAVSENREYLGQKERRQESRCEEFNSFAGLPAEKTMPRQVFAIPPHVMSKFLRDYMKLMASGKQIDSKITLRLLDQAKTRNVAQARNFVQSKVSSILH